MTFPDGFSSRADETPDTAFYAQPRFVLHHDDAAVAEVGALYEELGLDGEELAANPQAHERVVQDLDADPRLPFADASFDAVVDGVSIDDLVDPVAVLAEVARVLRPGGVSVCTFSNRVFPTKAVRGWLAAPEDVRPQVVAEYHRQAGGFAEPVVEQRLDGRASDPLWAVHARRD